jgi:alcohol dehydrogenase, propanol-preferring
MKTMLLNWVSDLKVNSCPLEFAEIPTPEPGLGELLEKISTCGVRHTELDEIEWRTPPPQFPVVPGHQVVGRVAEV